MYHKTTRAILGLIVISLILHLNCGQKGESNMPMFRGNLQHNGVFHTRGGDKLIGPRWKFQAEGGVESSPVIVDDMVYFGSSGGYLYAVHAEMGQEIWKFKTGGDLFSSPAVSNRAVYFGSGDGNLYAVAADTGQKRWHFTSGGEVISSPAVYNGVVYFGSGDRNLYAVAADTGQKRWQFNTGGEVASSPAIHNGVVYFGSGDGNLYAVAADTGQKRWHFKTGDEVISSPAVHDGVVYFGSDDENFYAVDIDTGKEKWRFRTRDQVRTSPALFAGIVYFGSKDEYLYAVDIKTGQEKWKFRTRSDVHSSPSIADGLVYFGSSDYHIYAVDLETGQGVWKFKTENEVISSPWISRRMIYFGSKDWQLYALEMKTGWFFSKSRRKSEEDLTAFIRRHTKALQDEDLEAYMATLDKQSPGYEFTVDQGRLLFDMYDLVHKFGDIEVLEKSDKHAKVKFVHIVKKLSGSIFRDVKCTEIHSLKKVRGRWKIYKSEAIDVEFLDVQELPTVSWERMITPGSLGKGISWACTYGGYKSDSGYSAMQTADGGYILCGSTSSFGARLFNVWLVKTDAHGKKQWERSLGGKQGDDAKFVQQTSDGGYMLVGTTHSFGLGSSDIWLIKTNKWGGMQWERTFGGSKWEEGCSGQQTSDGGFILTGRTASYEKGGQDGLLVKTDALGRKQWVRVLGGPYDDLIFAVRQASDEGYILAGGSRSFGKGSWDIWLIKTDRHGQKQWDRNFGGPGTDMANDVIQDSDGGYILVGLTDSYGAGKFDVWLIKTDMAGRKQWERTFGGAGSDIGNSVQQNPDGDYILAAETDSFGAGNRDAWLIKTDSEGRKQWERTFGGQGSDTVKCVRPTSDGEYILVGSTDFYASKGGDVLLIKVKPGEYQTDELYGKKTRVPYFDDFSSDKGWTNETSGDFTIRDGRLAWNVKRDKVQKMYVPIEEYSGAFRLSFDFQLTYRQNNVWLEVGLAESLTGAQDDPANDPIGTFVKFGWVGGGTPYSVYYVIPLARYPDQSSYNGHFEPRAPSTYIAYTEDRWYNAVLEVIGTSWRLTVKDSSGRQLGERTGSFPAGFGVYKYIYIGNPDNEDWPEGNGYLDNLAVLKAFLHEGNR